MWTGYIWRRITNTGGYCKHIHASFRFLWPCIVNIRWRERTNKMQLIRCLLSNFYLNMFRASLCPSSGGFNRGPRYEVMMGIMMPETCWDRSLIINVNKNPTEATVSRYLFTAKLLYMFRVSQHPLSGVLKTVPAASGTSSMTCTGGCGYSF